MIFRCFILVFFIMCPLSAKDFTEDFVQGSLEDQLSYIKSLKPREKVSQLILGVVNGDTFGPFQRQKVITTPISNILLFNFSNGLYNKKQISKLCTSFQEVVLEHSSIPPFIATDQEGGVVQRLKEGFSDFPGNMALAATKSPSYAYRQALQTAKEMREVGINMNLAPVVDINVNPKNPVIGVRAFSDDKISVYAFAREYLRGLKEGRVIGVLKHYPGHGDTMQDSHLHKAVVDKSFKELLKQELYPFFNLLSVAPAVMTAHVCYPQVDAENIATLSRKWLEEILKNERAFEGLVLSDSLSMNSVLGSCKDFEEAKQKLAYQAYRALLAGVDLLLIGRLEWQQWESSIEQDHELLRSCIESLSEYLASDPLFAKRVDAALQKVLTFKAQHLQRYEQQDFSKEDPDLALKICQESLTCLSNKKMWEAMFYSAPHSFLLIAWENLVPDLERLLPELGEQSKLYPLNEENLSTSFEALKSEVSAYDRIILLVGRHQYDPYFSRLLLQLSGEEELLNKLILVGLDSPYPLFPYRDKALVLYTYSQKNLALKNLFTHIRKGLLPKGKIPIKLS